MAVLVAIAVVRELLGFGSVLGFRVMPEGFVPWTIMITAPSAFFLVAMVMWLARHLQARREAAAKAAKAAPKTAAGPAPAKA